MLGRIAALWSGAKELPLPASPSLTMLFPAEVATICELIRDEYAGWGEIADLGSWMGGSTVALAHGLHLNQRVRNKSNRIHAYDRFVWETWMLGMAGAANVEKFSHLRPNDSFLSFFLEQTAPYEKYIQANPGDLNAQPAFSKPIEYLFIDVMKNWALSNTVVQKFFPQLRPGKSILHQQDFVHVYTPWIQLLAFRFREYFSLLKPIAGTPSVLFRYTKQVPEESLNKTYSFDDFSPDEFEEAFDYACYCVAPDARPTIRATRIWAFIHQERWETAQVELDKLKIEFPQPDHAIGCMDRHLKSHFGQTAVAS